MENYVPISLPVDADSSANFCWIVSEDYKFIVLDDTVEKNFTLLFGIRPAIGKSMIDTVSKVDLNLADRWKKLFDIAKEKGNVAVHGVHNDKQRVLNIKYAVKSTHGSEDTYLISATINSPDASNVEDNAKTVNAILSSFENSHVAMWSVDRKKNVLAFNPAFLSFYKIFFSDRPESPTVFPEDTPSEEVKQKWENRFQSLFSGNTYNGIDVHEADSGPIGYRIEGKPLIEDGKVVGACFEATDLSIQINQERLIRRQNEDLRKLTYNFEKLVYSASHDLRSPITTTKGLIHLIKLDYSRENVNTCLDHMTSTLDKLELAVREMGQFAFISKIKAKEEVVSMAKLMKAVVKNVESVNGYESVDIVLKVKKEDIIITDPHRLTVALTNLVTNSIQFRDRNKKAYVILYANAFRKGRMSVEVIDNGIGIPADQQDKIFDMFYKATIANTGAGLGLFIAKEAVSTIGGSIKVSSQVGVGTRFKIDLTFREL